jgi:hypothetical protein
MDMRLQQTRCLIEGERYCGSEEIPVLWGL